MWAWGSCRKLDHELDGRSLGFDDDGSVEVLRTGEDVKAEKIDFCSPEGLDKGRNLLRVDAELLWPTAHPHPRALHPKRGVDSHRDARATPELLSHRDHASSLVLRFELDRHSRSDRLGELGGRLPGPGEADPLGRRGCVQGRLHL